MSENAAPNPTPVSNGAGVNNPSGGVDPSPSAQSAGITAAELVDQDNDTFPGSPAPGKIEGAPTSGENAAKPGEVKKSGRGGARPGAGRKPLNKEVSTGPVFSGEGQPAVPEPAAPVDYEALASQVFFLVTAGLGAALGPQWFPRAAGDGLPSDAEISIPGIARYLKLKGMKELPPWAELAAIGAGYALRPGRLNGPETKERLFGLWLKTKNFFGKLFGGRSRSPQPIRSEHARQGSAA